MESGTELVHLSATAPEGLPPLSPAAVLQISRRRPAPLLGFRLGPGDGVLPSASGTSDRLFPEIGRRVTAFVDSEPEKAKSLIRCGIGDVTDSGRDQREAGHR